MKFFLCLKRLKKMTRLSQGALFALACISSLAASRPRIPSPTTWLRDKVDVKLDASIKDFFDLAREEDGSDTDEQKLIKPLEGNRVQMLDDTLVSDYISVSYLHWDDATPAE